MPSSFPRVVLLNNVEVPVSGLKLQHLGKQPGSGFFPFHLFFSPQSHFASKMFRLPHITGTHIQHRVHTKLARRTPFDHIHPTFTPLLLPSLFHPCFPIVSHSLVAAFLFSLFSIYAELFTVCGKSLKERLKLFNCSASKALP